MRLVVLLIVLSFPVLDVLATIRFARWTGIPTLAWLARVRPRGRAACCATNA